MFIPEMAPDTGLHEPALTVLQVGQGGSRREYRLAAWAFQIQHICGFE